MAQWLGRLHRRFLVIIALITIQVAPNMRINGKTSNHNVDIYWEFIEKGIKYRTVFEIKDLDRFDEKKNN